MSKCQQVSPMEGAEYDNANLIGNSFSSWLNILKEGTSRRIKTRIFPYFVA